MSMQRVMGGRGLERGPRGSKRAHSRGTIVIQFLWTGTIGPKKLAGQHQDGVTMGLARVPQCQCTPWSEHGAWARRSCTGAAPEAGVHGGGKRE